MGNTVFLSASVPNTNEPEFLRWGVRPRSVDEAVTSLTAALLRRGIGLVFGGHPSISPLVATVALQQRGWKHQGPPPITIYQSEAYRGVLPDETWALFRSGVAHIVWTERTPGEERPFPASLRTMRGRMLGETAPAAMVCVGGMKGIVDEAHLFQAMRGGSGGQVFLLAGTGGATAMLARTPALLTGAPAMVLDADFLAPDGGPAADDADEPVPYPYVMEKFADRIGG